MSILFPKLNKSRQWDYRPIYYDPEKDERHERLKQLKEEREAEKIISRQMAVINRICIEVRFGKRLKKTEVYACVKDGNQGFDFLLLCSYFCCVCFIF